MFIKMPFLINNLCVTHAHATVWLFSNSLINKKLKNRTVNPVHHQKNFPAMVCLPILRTMKQWPLAKEWQPLDEIRLDRP